MAETYQDSLPTDSHRPLAEYGSENTNSTKQSGTLTRGRQTTTLHPYARNGERSTITIKQIKNSMMTWLYIIYALISIGVFVYFQLDHYTAIENLAKTEYVIVTLLLSLVAPVALIIIAIGYPFYWLHRLFHPEEVKPAKSDDDDEPQGFDYEEHEDWTDGNTEYEDD